jgi:carbohydrate diacid regulator
MGTLTTPQRAELERVADAISERTAELLQTRICVTDDHGVVIASNDRSLIGRPPDVEERSRRGNAIHIPLTLDAGVGEVGEVIVNASFEAGQVIPPRLAHALVGLVVNQVAVVDRLPNQHELRNRVIYALLQGGGDQSGILREAKLLGMDLAPPRAVVLIDAAEFINGCTPARLESTSEEIRRRSQLVVASVVRFFQLPDDMICATSGDGEVAVLKASDSKNLETWVDRDDDPEPASPSWANLVALKRAGRALLTRLRHDTGATVNIGIGRYHPGIPGLAHSYDDARAALSLGRRFQGQNRVHCLDGLGIAAFVGLSDERTKVDLASHLLSPLDHEPDLLKTLSVFFEEDCCSTSAASRLRIHRNTLSYRLEKVASMSGLDPRRFDDAVQIRLALVVRSLGETPA